MWSSSGFFVCLLPTQFGILFTLVLKYWNCLLNFRISHWHIINNFSMTMTPSVRKMSEIGNLSECPQKPLFEYPKKNLGKISVRPFVRRRRSDGYVIFFMYNRTDERTSKYFRRTNRRNWPFSFDRPCPLTPLLWTLKSYFSVKLEFHEMSGARLYKFYWSTIVFPYNQYTCTGHMLIHCPTNTNALVELYVN